MAPALNRLPRRLLLSSLLAVVAFASSALAVVPTAPTNLRADFTNNASGNLIWRMTWMDNSTTETHFRFYLFQGGQYQGELQNYNSTNQGTTSYTGELSTFLVLPTLTGQVQFYVAAYNSTTGEQSGTVGVTFSSGPTWQTPVNIAAPSSIPTNLAATPSTVGGDGSVRLTFTDNTNCELYFEVQVKKPADTLWQSTFVDFNTTTPDVSFYKPRSYGADGVQDPVGDTTPDDELMFLPALEPGTTYQIRVRARGITADLATATYSDWSTTTTTTTQAFKAPTGLTATRTGESNYTLAFTKNSTALSGYHIQFRKQGTTTWLDYGYSDSPFFSNITVGPMGPNTAYEFQVRNQIRSSHSAQTAPTVFSAYSNTALGNTATGFNAPTNLTATSPSEGKVNLTWTDNSTAEGNYQIQYRVKGTTDWLTYTYVAENVTTMTNQVVAPGQILEFRVRATSGASAEITSAFTNTAEVTTIFNAPTNFNVTPSATDPYHLSFAWTDNSAVETGYDLQYRKVGEAAFASRKFVYANGGTAPNNMSAVNLPEFEPGTSYEFKVRAAYVDGTGSIVSGPAFSSVVTFATKNGFSGKPYAPITMGTPFIYQLATISQQTRTSWSVGTLPAGLSFDSGTGVISGTPTVAGLFTVPLTANFTGGTSHVMNLALRILRPKAAPQIAAAIGTQAVAPGADATIDLTTKFSDLDTEAALRMSTTKGNLDIVFYSSLAPATVNNFLSYNYTDTIFHRSPAGFVMQGGGYKPYVGTAGAPNTDPTVFESVFHQAPVANEPGISNIAGTLAMAKVGDDPDSATSEFFFSLGDNSGNLDNQNGGFTVFGRLSTPSVTALNSVAVAARRANYAVKLLEGGTVPSAANMVFSDIPTDQAADPAGQTTPTPIDPTKLIKVLSVNSLPVLSYAITTAPNSGVATATLNGTNLQIHGVGPGSSSLIITATDVDGNATQQTVPINVSQVPASVSFDSATLTQTYNGTPRPVTATTSPGGLGVVYTYEGSSTAPTNAGSYAVVATISDGNYVGTTSGTLVVSKAVATVTLGSLDQPYTGSARTATATTSPAGLAVGFTYDGSASPPTAHGSYAVVGTVTDANYTGTSSGTLTIRGQTVSDWRTQNFTPQQISAGLAADGADADGDGQTNLAEYALGTSPTSATSPLGTPVRDANGLTLTFTRPKGLPNVTYGAESSDNMVNWTPLTVEVVTDGPVQTVRVRDPLTGGNPARRFIRLLFQSSGS